MDMKSFFIVELLVALLAAGYFYYDSTRTQVKIDDDRVKVQANQFSRNAPNSLAYLSELIWG